MARPGPRGKYTPEAVQAICDALRLGLTRADACVHGGISDETFARWLRQHVEFMENVKKAELQAKMSRVARITQAGKNGTWQADAWVLERKYPDEFGQKLVIRVLPEQADILKKHGLSPHEAWLQFIQELANAEQR